VTVDGSDVADLAERHGTPSQVLDVADVRHGAKSTGARSDPAFS
jgi:hypothetical protein